MLSFRRYAAAICLFALVDIGQAFAAVGTIDSLEGDVSVSGPRGARTGQAGLELDEGDTVVTSANAWALLVMSDGASITMRPASQLRLDTYRYNPSGPAAENTGLISLMQGAFRSITGAIGQTNRAGYQVKTPSATIGIRGTDHEPAYYPPAAASGDQNPGTYDKVTTGESFIRNARGEVSIKPGQSAFVHHNARTAPRLLRRPPAFYQQHAEIDKRAAPRRDAFHERVRQERSKRDMKGDSGQKGAQKARENDQADRAEARQKRNEERRREKAQQREARKQHETHKKLRE